MTGGGARPRLGVLGAGWIGRHRLQAMVEADVADVVGVAEPADEAAVEALALAPDAVRVNDLDALLALGLDGLVIATPSALHADQSIQALEAGAAVFCQKPLGRTASEVEAVVTAARRADRLLSVDLSYRFTTGMTAVREQARSGALGRVFAADLVFHNAYGPDKPWFYDPALSGGGCVVDLGVHLVDLALWTLDWPEVAEVRADLFAGGRPWSLEAAGVEDYAVAALTLIDGAAVRIACSWKLHAGREAEIGAAFHGTEGGAAFHNLDGSFYAFSAESRRGTVAEPLSGVDDGWNGRAAKDWVRRLAAGERFDPDAERLIDSARVLDRIYGR